MSQSLPLKTNTAFSAIVTSSKWVSMIFHVDIEIAFIISSQFVCSFLLSIPLFLILTGKNVLKQWEQLYHFSSNRSLFIFYSSRFSILLKFFFIFSVSSIFWICSDSYLSLRMLSPSCFYVFASLLSNWMHFSRIIDLSWFPCSLSWKILSSFIFFSSFRIPRRVVFSFVSFSTSALRLEILLESISK